MMVVSQIGHGGATRALTRGRRSLPCVRTVTPATIADALLAAAWIGLVADSLRVTRAERALAGRLTIMGRPPRAARVAVLVLLLAGAALLEYRSGGRLSFHPVAAGAGTALAWAGVVLHARARRALGIRWSPAVAVPPGHEVVTHGPYAIVRHPLYLGVLLLAAGTVLAHTSAATLCIAAGFAAGMARKIPAEERALRGACGDAWTRYAADVPALVPRLSRGRR
jgi:protein-S-isoprenylcysteine O-methyltransferase Ste14